MSLFPKLKRRTHLRRNRRKCTSSGYIRHRTPSIHTPIQTFTKNNEIRFPDTGYNIVTYNIVTHNNPNEIPQPDTPIVTNANPNSNYVQASFIKENTQNNEIYENYENGRHQAYYDGEENDADNNPENDVAWDYDNRYHATDIILPDEFALECIAGNLHNVKARYVLQPIIDHTMLHIICTSCPLHILKFLHEECNITPTLADLVAICGQSRTVAPLEKIKYICTTCAITPISACVTRAMSASRTDIIMYLHIEKNVIGTSYTVEELCRKQHVDLELLMYFVEICKIPVTRDVLHYACIDCPLPVIKFLCAYRAPNQTNLYFATINENKDVIAYLTNTHYLTLDDYYYEITYPDIYLE